MSSRIAAIPPLNINAKSRYYKKLENDLNSGDEYRMKKASKAVEEQIQLWNEDLSCPYDETTQDFKHYSEIWTEWYYGEINLELWKNLA